MSYPNFLNNQLNNSNLNNLIPQQIMNTQYLPQMHVIRVNGQAGAKNLRMAPNSDTLVLDETAPILWYAQTDGTGYLTVTPFDISPHQNQQQTTINTLSDRIAKLEEEMANVQQSYIVASKQPKKQRQPVIESANDSTTQAN